MPITPVHGLAALVAVRFFTSDRRLLLLAFAAGMLPDLDGIGLFFSLDLFYRFHRELLHPLVYALVLALPAAAIMNGLWKTDFKKAFAVFAFSFGSHVATDVFFTSWPVKLFWPFSAQEYSFPFLEGHNLLLAAALLAAFAVQLLLPVGNEKKKKRAV